MSKVMEFYKDGNGDSRFRVVENGVTLGEMFFRDNIFFFTREVNDGVKYATYGISNNSSYSVVVGDKRYDRALFMDYVVERGSLYQAGTIIVLNKEATPLDRSGGMVVGDDVGIGFAFTTNANEIRMTMTLTNATHDARIKFKTKSIAR